MKYRILFSILKPSSQTGRKYLQIILLTKYQYPEEKTNDQSEQWTKHLNRGFPKIYIHMVNEHMKKKFTTSYQRNLNLNYSEVPHISTRMKF